MIRAAVDINGVGSRDSRTPVHINDRTFDMAGFLSHINGSAFDMNRLPADINGTPGDIIGRSADMKRMAVDINL